MLRRREPRALVHQPEGPDRAARLDLAGGLATRRRSAAESRKHAHVLLAFVRVGDRLRRHARARLELPELLAGVFVESDELAGQLAAEHDAAPGDERARPHRKL